MKITHIAVNDSVVRVESVIRFSVNLFISSKDREETEKDKLFLVADVRLFIGGEGYSSSSEHQQLMPILNKEISDPIINKWVEKGREEYPTEDMVSLNRAISKELSLVTSGIECREIGIYNGTIAFFDDIIKTATEIRKQ